MRERIVSLPWDGMSNKGAPDCEVCARRRPVRGGRTRRGRAVGGGSGGERADGGDWMA